MSIGLFALALQINNYQNQQLTQSRLQWISKMTSVKFVEMPVTNYNPSLYLFHYMIRFLKGCHHLAQNTVYRFT